MSREETSSEAVVRIFGSLLDSRFFLHVPCEASARTGPTRARTVPSRPSVCPGAWTVPGTHRAPDNYWSDEQVSKQLSELVHLLHAAGSGLWVLLQGVRRQHWSVPGSPNPCLSLMFAGEDTRFHLREMFCCCFIFGHHGCTGIKTEALKF